MYACVCAVVVPQFQFHKGTIKTIINNRLEFDAAISIP